MSIAKATKTSITPKKSATSFLLIRPLVFRLRNAPLRFLFFFCLLTFSPISHPEHPDTVSHSCFLNHRNKLPGLICIFHAEPVLCCFFDCLKIFGGNRCIVIGVIVRLQIAQFFFFAGNVFRLRGNHGLQLDIRNTRRDTQCADNGKKNSVARADLCRPCRFLLVWLLTPDFRGRASFGASCGCAARRRTALPSSNVSGV